MNRIHISHLGLGYVVKNALRTGMFSLFNRKMNIFCFLCNLKPPLLRLTYSTTPLNYRLCEANKRSIATRVVRSSTSMPRYVPSAESGNPCPRLRVTPAPPMSVGLPRCCCAYSWVTWASTVSTRATPSPGIVQLLTLGGCGIWALIDLILIVTNSFTDGNGKVIHS